MNNIEKWEIELNLLEELKEKIELAGGTEFALAIIEGNINGRKAVLGADNDTKASSIY